MQHVLSVTIQGKIGFSTGYVWWMGPEEVLFWCREHRSIGDEVRLRIDWAMGTALIDCKATIHSALPERISTVKDGMAYFGTYQLVDPGDEKLLQKGLHLANPALKVNGSGSIPPALAPVRRIAERHKGRRLGMAGEAVQPRRATTAKPVLRPKAAREATLAPEESTSVHLRRMKGQLLQRAASNQGKEPAKAAPKKPSRPHPPSAQPSEPQSIPKPPDAPGPARQDPQVEVTGNDKLPEPRWVEPLTPAEQDYPEFSQLVQGKPHSALLRISDTDQLLLSIGFHEQTMDIRVKRKPDLPYWDEVALQLLLPDNTFLEFKCKVVDKTDQSMNLSVDTLDEIALDALKFLIEG